MWLEKFFRGIDRSWLGRLAESKIRLIAETDPQHIHVEKVRSFFGVPHAVALLMCEDAVREGLFVKRIGYLCPNQGRVILYAAHGQVPAESVSCFVCEQEGLPYEFDASSLKTIAVYGLRETVR